MRLTVVLGLLTLGSCNGGTGGVQQVMMRDPANPAESVNTAFYKHMDGTSRTSSFAASLEDIVVNNPDDIAKFVGYDVRLMMGDPELRRYDRPASIWQFTSDQCILDIYLDNPSNDNADTSPVIYYDYRRPDGYVGPAPKNLGQCIKAIRQG